MAKRRWNIEYLDGTSEEVAIGLRQVVEIERRWPADKYVAGAPTLEAIAYAVFLVKGGKVDDVDSLNAFLDTVDDCNPVVDEAEESTDPSGPAAADD